MRAAPSVLAVVLLVLVIGACGGESSEEKAQATVCDAQDDIARQVDDLTSLTPATVTTDAVTKNLNAIKNDLTDIADAQSDLGSDRRGDIEAATKAFAGSVKEIAGQLGSSLSASDAKARFVTALDELAGSYQKAFATVDCE